MLKISKNKGFSLIELLVVMSIIAIAAAAILPNISKQSKVAAFDAIINTISTSFDNISQNAKNGVTNENFTKFKNSSDDFFKQQYADNINLQGKSEANSRYSPLNQTAFYYGMYFNIGKTFFKEVQWEQEGCQKRREALKQKMLNGTRLPDINYGKEFLDMNLYDLISKETNLNSSRNISGDFQYLESEMLDGGSCYISSQNIYYGGSAPLYLNKINFNDGTVDAKRNYATRDVGVVVLVDANDPFKFRIFRSDQKVNALKNFFYVNTDGLEPEQKKYIEKNYGVIEETKELDRVDLQFSITEKGVAGINCDDDEYVDFSSRYSSGKMFNKTIEEKGLLCLTLTKDSIEEMSRSKR